MHKLMAVMTQNGQTIDEIDGYKMMPDFQEWFYDNILGAHTSIITEMLNNIRWAIYEYLKPEFDRAYKWLGEPKMYTF